MKKLVHHPNFLQLVFALKPVLRLHPPLATMHIDDLVDWVAWYWNRGTISWQIDDGGNPQGVCLIKLFRRMEQFLEPNVHDPCGKFCLIELLVSTEPVTTGILCKALVDRWGPQEIMMWDRGDRTKYGAPRMYRWDQFMKLTKRITYGLI